ncbi:hypothetical protein HK102_005012, partial [Quaeritorhiza haematococci]
YGFAPKGSSVILFRNNQLRKWMYTVTTDWPGGIYASPTIAGSRPGALVAGCWTAMVRMGESGYVQATKEIVGVARRIKSGISSIPRLRVIGDPLISVVAFDALPPLSTYGLADLLSRKGWHLNVLQYPPAIHIACTYLTAKGSPSEKNGRTIAEKALLDDIREAVEMLKENPGAGEGEVAAIYGSAATVPDRSVVGDIACGFLDALTKA